jgi:hypothetical protein
MADRVSEIELELKTILEGIDGSTSTTGYTYYNDVKSVNIDDEVIADADPSIVIYQDPEEVILSGVSRAYQNLISITVQCKLALDTEVAYPKFAINTKMNEMLSDIKFAISNNYHLNGSCDMCEIISSSRSYTMTSDNYRAGDLLVKMEITYSQSRLNPNLNACI